MEEKIRKFFGKKKDHKFKGGGHRLNETSAPPEPKAQKTDKTPAQDAPSEEQRQAGLAALARLANTPGSSVRTNFAYQHGKVELENNPGAAALTDKVPAVLAVLGVFYRCPFIAPDVLPKSEWKERVKNYLQEGLKDNLALTSCLMIHTSNKNKEKVAECIEILCTYLKNIILHPEEEKYRKIRKSNRTFSDKVLRIEGALEFLSAAGFKPMSIDLEDGSQEEFLVYENEVDKVHLEFLMETLRTSDPIRLELDRNAQVLSPSQAATMLDLPSEFYRLTVDELRREMKQRSETLETSSQLRTKAMREKEEQKELKKYQYTLIRVRFPEGLFLQGTFNVYEPFIEVRKFVQNCLEVPVPFELVTALGKPISDGDDETTLINLKLVPAVLLNISIKPFEGSSEKSFLKGDLIEKMKTI